MPLIYFTVVQFSQAKRIFITHADSLKVVSILVISETETNIGNDIFLRGNGPRENLSEQLSTHT